MDIGHSCCAARRLSLGNEAFPSLLLCLKGKTAITGDQGCHQVSEMCMVNMGNTGKKTPLEKQTLFPRGLASSSNQS